MSSVARSVSVENARGQLSCSICQRRFTDMTVSSCFHTFCPSCLEANAGQASRRGGQYECPICRTPTRLPSAGTDSLGISPDGASWEDGDPVGQVSSAPEDTGCDVCGYGKPATSECLQCKEKFCDDCTKAHMKMKASRYHSDQVTPLQPERRETLADKYCPRHPSQEVLFVCRKCDVSICNICKLLEHESHVTKLVSEEAREVRQRLAGLLRQEAAYVDHLQNRLRLMSDRQYQYPYELEQEIEKVRKQATKMHLDIEREKTDAETELEQHYNRYIDRANESSQRLRQDYQQRAALVRDAQVLMNSANNLTFVNEGNYLCRRLQQGDSDLSDTQMDQEHPYKRFVPVTALPGPQTHRLVGEVTEHWTMLPVQTKKVDTTRASPTKQRATPFTTQVPSPRSAQSHTSQQPGSAHSASSSQVSDLAPRGPLPSEPVRLQAVSSFRIPHDDISGYIYGLAPLAGHQLAWVTMLDHRNIVLVDTQGTIVNAVDLGEPCEGITSDAEGGCFVTCPRSRSVRHVTSTGEISPVVLNLDSDPHGMAGWQYFDTRKRTMVEELYICFTNSKDTPWYEKATGSVRALSFLGQDLGKSFPVHSPVRIDVDLPTRMLCISDHMNGCVTICDKRGQYTTALYTGHAEHELFKPLGVCFDDTSHVIVADWTGGKVSRIAQDGTLVQHLLTGVDGPQSVAMGDDRTLWVGSKKGTVSVYKVT